MGTDQVNAIIEMGLALFLVIVPVCMLRYYKTRLDKDGKPMGIGWRAIQTIVVIMIIPAVLILSIGRFIDGSLTGTLLGSLIGYVLATKD